MKTELGIAIAIVISYVCKLMHLPGSDQMLVLSLTSLAIIYMPGAIYFFSHKTIKQQNKPFSVISGFLLSITVVGLLFKIMHWPFAYQYLTIGLFTLPILLFVTYLLINKSIEELKVYYRNMLIRICILTTLVIIFYF